MLPLFRGQTGVFARSTWPQLFLRPIVEVVDLVAQIVTWHALHAVTCADRSHNTKLHQH